MAQLIDMPPDELSGWLGPGSYPAGPSTTTRLDVLVAELEKVCEQGPTIGDEELVTGLGSVAEPICENEGQIVAAISIAVAVARVSRQEVEENLDPKVVNTAREISLVLGARL